MNATVLGSVLEQRDFGDQVDSILKIVSQVDRAKRGQEIDSSS